MTEIGSAIAGLIRDHSALDLALIAIGLIQPALSIRRGKRLALSYLPQRVLIAAYWRTMLRGWLIAAAVLLVWAISERPFAALGLEWPLGPASWFGLIAVGAATVWMLARLAFSFRPTRDELETLKARLDSIRIAPRSASELAAFLPAAVTAGVWEEIYFRAYMMWFFEPTLGVVGAALVSSAIFGVGHAYQGWRGVLRTGIAGLILAAGYALTRDLWWLMALHAVADIYAGVLSYRVYSMHRRRAYEVRPAALAAARIVRRLREAAADAASLR
jgi:membrane protease YdiL (CAAX protease family)